VWSQQNYQKLLVTVKYFESSQAAVPATLSRGNAGMKISESVCCKLGLLPRDIVHCCPCDPLQRKRGHENK